MPEPFERLLCFFKTGIDRRYSVRRDIDTLRQLVQLIKHLQRIAFLLSHRISMSQQRCRQRTSAGKSNGLLKLSDRFVKHRLLFISQSQHPIRNNEIRIYFERFPVLIYRLVILAREVQKRSQIGVYDEREWLKLLRSLLLCNRIVQAPHRCQVGKSIPVVRCCVSWF